MKNAFYLFKISIVHMKIRTKFILVFLIIMSVLAGVMLTAITRLYRGTYNDYSVELTEHLVSQIATNTNQRIDEIEEVIYSVIQNKVIKEQLYKDGENLEIYENKVIQATVQTMLDTKLTTVDYIERVAILSEFGKLYTWHNTEAEILSNPVLQLHFKEILDQGLDRSNRPYWIESPFYKDEILIIQPIIDEENIENRLGYIMFGLKTVSLFESVENSEFPLIKSQHIAVVGDDNILFFETSLINRRLFLRLYESENYIEGNLNQLFLTYDNEKFFMIEKRLENKPWNIVVLVPQQVFEKGLERIQLLVFFMSITGLILAVIAAYYISGNITKNIRLLEKSMERLEAGDFSLRIKPHSYDEVGRVSLRFNYMSAKIQSLIKELYNTEVEKRNVEQEVLKAQINPHFLYNTLGSIKWLAMSKGQHDISELVTSLVGLLKKSIKQTGKFQTLESELEYIKYYMAIQVATMDTIVEVNYQIEPDVLGLYVLNFMLQPIVENALVHGLSYKKKDNHITIKAYRHDDVLIIKVIDNGKGIPEETIKEIFGGKKKKERGFNSIGIKNVNDRLKLYFGEEYGLIYKSYIDQGTMVIFRLPIMREAEEVEE